MPDSNPSLDESGVHRVPRRTITLSRLLESILEAGRDILERRRQGGSAAGNEPAALGEQCQVLLDHRGEASGLYLASQILAGYESLDPDDRLRFFEILNNDFGADPEAVLRAAEEYHHEPVFERLAAVAKAVEAPRLKLFRRLNMAPGGTGKLVAMRGHLLESLPGRGELKPLDSDLRHLLIAWFNPGFLVLDRIDWSSSGRVLEKIIKYEAVHEINGWDELRGRLRDDRRCFAFFHPAMPDDPVIFVEVALSSQSAAAIQPLIDSERDIGDARQADTATFYSISNCHLGLQGISFGNFLIKQVTEELRHDLENLKRFETLSPVPGFRGWLDSTADRESLQIDAEEAMMSLCAHYLLNEKQGDKPMDPVARFHLSNGASLDRLNWAADNSAAGVERSAGIMVNYVYHLEDIEKNHESYFSEGQIVASAAVRKLVK